MAISTKQRKSVGRRYSSDPAMDAEIARLAMEYQLAPGREARGMQIRENEKSREQSESQYSRSLAQQESQFGRGLEQSDKNAARQEEQFYVSLAQAQAQHAASIKLATDNYNLAVKNAKDDVEYKAAMLTYQQNKDAADRAYQADRDKAASSSGMVGTLGNTALTGAMLRAATMDKAVYNAAGQLVRPGEPFLGKTVSGLTDKLFGGGAEAVTPAVTPSTVAPTTTTTLGTVPEAVPGYRIPVDTTIAPQSSLSGTNVYGITPTVQPVGGAGLEGLGGGGIESGIGYGGQIGAGSAYGGGVTGAGSELYGGVESGIGLSGEIGGASGMGASSGLAGAGAMTIAGYAAPAVIAAHYGMPILGGWLGAQSPQDYRNDPSSNFFTQAANITSYEWDRPIEAGLEALNLPSPGGNTLLGAILNPGMAVARYLGFGGGK